MPVPCAGVALACGYVSRASISSRGSIGLCNGRSGGNRRVAESAYQALSYDRVYHTFFVCQDFFTRGLPYASSLRGGS